MHVWGVFYHAKLDNYTHRHLCALKLSASSPILFFRTESWCRAKPGCFSRFVPVLFVVHRHYDPVMNQSLLQFAKYSKKRCISSANLPLAVHAIDTRQSDWFRSWEPEDYWGSCCFLGMVLRQWFHLIQRHENGGCYNRETTGKKQWQVVRKLQQQQMFPQYGHLVNDDVGEFWITVLDLHAVERKVMPKLGWGDVGGRSFCIPACFSMCSMHTYQIIFNKSHC